MSSQENNKIKLTFCDEINKMVLNQAKHFITEPMCSSFSVFNTGYSKFWHMVMVDIPGLQIRVCIGKFSLFLIQNICCGYSKEPSQLDGSFEHPKHMFKLLGKKIKFSYLDLCHSLYFCFRQ